MATLGPATNSNLPRVILHGQYRLYTPSGGVYYKPLITKLPSNSNAYTLEIENDSHYDPSNIITDSINNINAGNHAYNSDT